MDAPGAIATYRVIYGDTDAMGVVYYGNYLRLFERARLELLRSLGLSYSRVEAEGLRLPVAEAYCRYLRPARYEDLLEVEVWVSWLGRASMRIDYRVWRQGELLATGFTVHGCLDARGRPRRLPPYLQEGLRRALRPGEEAVASPRRRGT